MSLSVIILAKNEEKNIRDCILSAHFADEVIIIDDSSTDNTVKIAEELGARVCQRAMNGDWGGQQTYAIEQAKTEWIFFLDADERITEKLAEEVLEIIKKSELCAYEVPRMNYIMGEPLHHGGWYPDYGHHLVPRQGMRVEGLVHPQFVHHYPVRRLHHPITHYTYSSWEHYFNKLNLYTKLAAEKNFKNGKRANFIFDIVIRPCVAFLKMYIIKSGWRDGKIGFILAAFHYFYTMAKYVKLYYIQNTTEASK